MQAENVSVSITIPMTLAGAGLLRAAAAQIESRTGKELKATAALDDEAEDTTDAPPETRRRPGRPKETEEEKAAKRAKREKAEEKEPDAEEFEDETDGGGDDGLDLGDENENEKPAKEKKLTLDDDIIPAFKAFVAKHKSREKAGEVLAKFKVKSVRELPADKYPAVLKALKA